MRAVLALVALVAMAAAPAIAQVVVTITPHDEDVAQRDIAGVIVTKARERWHVLVPQLSPAKRKSCQTSDTACLRGIAHEALATHLLVIGIAAVGVRDHVVAVQLFDLDVAEPLFEESAVQPGALEELTVVNALASRLLAVPGPPPFVAPTNWLSQAGLSLAALALATAGTSAIVGAVLVEQGNTVAARNVFVCGLAASGLIALAGSAAIVLEDR